MYSVVFIFIFSIYSINSLDKKCAFPLCDTIQVSSTMCQVVCFNQSSYMNRRSESVNSFSSFTLYNIEYISQDYFKDLNMVDLEVFNSHLNYIDLRAFQNENIVSIANFENITRGSNFSYTPENLTYNSTLFLKEFYITNVDEQIFNIILKIAQIERSRNLYLTKTNFTNLNLSNFNNLASIEIEENLINDSVTIQLSNYITLVKFLDSTCSKLKLESVKDSMLSSITLIGNQLKSIEFPYLSQLKNLELENNLLLNISNINFNQLKYLDYISITKTNLTSFDSKILGKNMNKLTTLDLSRNNINDSVRIYNLPSLLEVELKFNYLTNLDKVSIETKNLVFLYLDFNLLNRIDKFDFNGTVDILSLNNNSFENFPKFPTKLLVTNLQNLYLNNNKIRFIYTSDLENLIQLTCLDLSYNLIEFIEFPFLESLTDLNLEFNMLTKISNLTFSKLLNLQSLKLGSNLIRQIDSNAFYLNDKIFMLNIQDNYLDKIPKISRNSSIGLVDLSKQNGRLVELKRSDLNQFYILENDVNLNLALNDIARASEDLFMLNYKVRQDTGKRFIIRIYNLNFIDKCMLNQIKEKQLTFYLQSNTNCSIICMAKQLKISIQYEILNPSDCSKYRFVDDCMKKRDNNDGKNNSVCKIEKRHKFVLIFFLLIFINLILI